MRNDPKLLAPILEYLDKWVSQMAALYGLKVWR